MDPQGGTPLLTLQVEVQHSTRVGGWGRRSTVEWDAAQFKRDVHKQRAAQCGAPLLTLPSVCGGGGRGRRLDSTQHSTGLGSCSTVQERCTQRRAAQGGAPLLTLQVGQYRRAQECGVAAQFRRGIHNREQHRLALHFSALQTCYSR
jgi:hypothetical protein